MYYPYLSKHPTSKALIFDLDGTLADTMPAHYQAWSETAKNFGFHFPESLFYELAGIPTFKIVDIINKMQNKQIDPQEAHQSKENYFLKYIDSVRPIKAVLDLAKEYFGQIPMAVGTGGVPDVAAKTLEVIGATHLFDTVVTAHDVSKYKPEPDTFLECARRMRVDPVLCQVFEDADAGIQAALKAGMIVTDVRKK